MNNEPTNEPELTPEQAALNIELGLELATKESYNYDSIVAVLNHFGTDVTGEQILEAATELINNAPQA